MLESFKFMIVRLTSLLVFLAAMAAPAFATNPALPSDGLEQRVDFWKKIYTQYGADDLVIHDRVYVNLVYDVATEATENEKTANIKSALREIRASLETPGKSQPVCDSSTRGHRCAGSSLCRQV